MWTCETKVSITALVVMCGTINVIGLGFCVLQLQESVVALSYGTFFTSASICQSLFLFVAVTSEKRIYMKLSILLAIIRPIFLLLFFFLLNLEERGMINPKSTPTPGYGARHLSAEATVSSTKPDILEFSTVHHVEEPEDLLTPTSVLYGSLALFSISTIADVYVIRRLIIYSKKSPPISPLLSVQSALPEPADSKPATAEPQK
ncbi:uncharacterized protein LOC135398997 isoform X1 [Ornithodoros turicata]|uniref:uncharacterized protein LOC135398997 isoform X1 n=1 Tax=Ornithodoros turicata TaxID=34597 RepID=UPI003138E21C